MSEQHGSERKLTGSFWSTRIGVVFIGFLVVAGLLLAFEHRAHILTGEGLLIGLLATCVLMHLFMHGGHGGHGGGDDRS